MLYNFPLVNFPDKIVMVIFTNRNYSTFIKSMTSSTVKPELFMYVITTRILNLALPLKELTGDRKKDKEITKENIKIFEKREEIKKKILKEITC